MINRSAFKSFIVGFSVLFIGPVVYMSLDNSPPYTFHKGELIPNPATSGQTVDVIWEYEVHRFCSGIVYRRIIGPIGSGAAIVHNYDPTVAVINPRIAQQSGPNKLVVTFSLPPSTSPGEFIYSATIEYNCNPLQAIFPLKVQLPQVPFGVRDRPIGQKK